MAIIIQNTKQEKILREKIKKQVQTRWQNELGKECFQEED